MSTSNITQARNREHKHEWTQQLKRLILENYSAEIPPHARQLVMEPGKAKQDGEFALFASFIAAICVALLEAFVSSLTNWVC